jgi:hypothetical protein
MEIPAIASPKKPIKKNVIFAASAYGRMILAPAIVAVTKPWTVGLITGLVPNAAPPTRQVVCPKHASIAYKLDMY